MGPNFLRNKSPRWEALDPVATERILAHLVKARETTAPEIAEALGLKPTAAYRALYTLSSWELVEDTGQRRTGSSGRPARVWRICPRP